MILQGFDVYDPTTAPNLQTLGTTICVIAVLVCLFRGYLALDYLQNVFVLALVSAHYPSHLSFFIEGFRISSFWFPVASVDAPALFKFKTAVSNMSLIGNTLHIFILFALYVSFLGAVSLADYFINKKQNQPSN